MSITAETAKEHANDPAVLCCRAEAGTVIEPERLEDPAIFDELVDSGLLNLDGCLTIGQVLGATLTETSDSLSALTANKVSGIKEVAEQSKTEDDIQVGTPVAFSGSGEMNAQVSMTGGILKISISEGKDIEIELPV